MSAGTVRGFCLAIVIGCLLVVGAPGGAEAAAPVVRSISAGNNHTCAVTTDNAAWCWGFNLDNQVGDLTTDDQYRPVRVHKEGGGLLAGVRSISAGSMITCAVTNIGDVWCWGGLTLPPVGQRGAVKVAGISNVTDVSVGDEGACARTSDGAGWCWGDNSYGEVGDGTTYPRAPTQIFAGGIVSIHQDAGHSCALKTDHSVWCWGRNDYGQLGDGTKTDRLTPVRVQLAGGGALTGVASLGEGNGDHECVVRLDATVWCWGNNGVGQVGDGTDTLRKGAVAVKLAGVKFGNAATVGTGYGHSCAARKNGSVWCWGWDEAGQLGDGSTVLQRTHPVRVKQGKGFLTGIQSIAVGVVHTCALTKVGVAWCWGSNYDGGVGDGSHAQLRTKPVKVRF